MLLSDPSTRITYKIQYLTGLKANYVSIFLCTYIFSGVGPGAEELIKCEEALNQILPGCDDHGKIKIKEEEIETEAEGDLSSDLAISPFKNLSNFSDILAELGGVESLLQNSVNKENFRNIHARCVSLSIFA